MPRAIHWRALHPLALVIGVVSVGLALLWLNMARPMPVQAQDLGLEISKTLRGGSDVQIGQVLEFVIKITNTGTISVTELDLVDTFVSDIVAPVGTGPFMVQEVVPGASVTIPPCQSRPAAPSPARPGSSASKAPPRPRPGRRHLRGQPAQAVADRAPPIW